MIVHFQNPGIIDLEAITVLGVNAKDETLASSPIGYFGTGLKYAIAILLRTGHTIEIFRGHDRYYFKSEPRVVRGKTFNFITMNGATLGFTTELGKNWQLWQALRELYSNTVDEDGSYATGRASPREDFTTINVYGELFAREFSNLDKIVLRSEPVHRGFRVHIHPGNNSHIFYKGIRTQEASKRSLFTYNLVSEETLTEDRTFSSPYTIGYRIVKDVQLCEDKEIISRVLTTGEDFIEGDFSFNSDLPSSEAFREQILHLRRTSGGRLNLSARTFAQSLKPDKDEFVEVKLSPYEQRLFDEAIALIKAMNCFALDRPIKIVTALPENALGRAYLKEQQIFIAKDTFSLGLVKLTGTLLEEITHLERGHADGRAMQDFFLDHLIASRLELRDAQGKKEQSSGTD